MSGTWFQNIHFDHDDFVALGGVLFESNPALMGVRYVERLAEPEACEVERTYFDSTGAESRTERIEIDCARYWNRIAYLDRYFQEHRSFPVLPIVGQ